MFTEQYVALRKMMFTNVTTSMKCIDGEIHNITASATEGNADLGYAMENARCREPSASYPGLYFGTGTTPAQKTDYILESIITSGLSITNGSRVEKSYGNGVYSYECSCILRNSSENEITITEIGAYGRVAYNSTTSYLALMERTVLTTPLTIAPGESKLLTYKVTFNQPS